MDISNSSPLANFSSHYANEEISPRFKDLKSPGASFLTSERNTRLVNNFSFDKIIPNYESGDNKLNTLIGSTNSLFSTNLHEVLLKSSNTQ
jgi:hypothetical protein